MPSSNAILYSNTTKPVLADVRSIVIAAGDIALQYLQADNIELFTKDDGSPVSNADFAVNEYLKKHLMFGSPEINWVSEESDKTTYLFNSQNSSQYPLTWIVDPIDGTSSYVARRDHWAISVALMQDNLPIMGVVYQPVTRKLYCAEIARGASVDGRPLHLPSSEVRSSTDTCVIACSCNQFGRNASIHLEKAIGSKVHYLERSSIACRLTEVASGLADATLSRRKCMYWDIAAADLIVSEAGGKISDYAGNALRYDSTDFSVDGFIASSAKWHSVLAHKRDAI